MKTVAAQLESKPAPWGPALAVLESTSIAKGIVCSDAALKRAQVTILHAKPISSGRFLFAFMGPEADVEEAFGAARNFLGDALSDSLLLSFPHPALWNFAAEVEHEDDWRTQLQVSALIIETNSPTSTIASADAALKAAEVTLRSMRLAMGISGKGFFTMTGELSEVQAAQLAAEAAAGNRLLASEVIASPADEIVGRLTR